MGAGLPGEKPTGQIQIRIRPDGRVYIDGLSGEMLEFAESLSPRDASFRRRLALLRKAPRRPQPPREDRECQDGDAEAGQ